MRVKLYELSGCGYDLVGIMEDDRIIWEVREGVMKRFLEHYHIKSAEELLRRFSGRVHFVAVPDTMKPTKRKVKDD
ncbi:hypothetical protein FH039_06585 [Thermococcus indicus]|uniref:Uncharacterized protein n=1 Tax=Thermococcus indicus TaxID=2586643 RepID=A0A4Y5SMB5_9EURY|nr:hypothetical protein [Thermococcus indicus]QDA31329.1 hypothetical protein FH039_06585 [Thermococcus indicus]